MSYRVQIVNEAGSVVDWVPVTDTVADMLPDVLNRGDISAALDYVLGTPEGGPSCGCGADHWSCDYQPDDLSDELAELDELEAGQ